MGTTKSGVSGWTHNTTCKHRLRLPAAMLAAKCVSRLSRTGGLGLQQSVRNMSVDGNRKMAVIGAGITGVTTARALMCGACSQTWLSGHATDPENLPPPAGLAALT